MEYAIAFQNIPSMQISIKITSMLYLKIVKWNKNVKSRRKSKSGLQDLSSVVLLSKIKLQSESASKLNT